MLGNINGSYVVSCRRGIVSREIVLATFRSLFDLGYVRVGTDDGWQVCEEVGKLCARIRFPTTARAFTRQTRRTARQLVSRHAFLFPNVYDASETRDTYFQLYTLYTTCAAVCNKNLCSTCHQPTSLY